MMCACGPYPQVGSATDGGWFGRGFYPSCDVSLRYARQNPDGGVMLIVKVLVGGVNTFQQSLCQIEPPRCFRVTAFLTETLSCREPYSRASAMS